MTRRRPEQDPNKTPGKGYKISGNSSLPGKGRSKDIAPKMEDVNLIMAANVMGATYLQAHSPGKRNGAGSRDKPKVGGFSSCLLRLFFGTCSGFFGSSSGITENDPKKTRTRPEQDPRKGYKISGNSSLPGKGRSKAISPKMEDVNLIMAANVTGATYLPAHSPGKRNGAGSRG